MKRKKHPFAQAAGILLSYVAYLLIILKADNVIDWSWWLVWSPILAIYAWFLLASAAYTLTQFWSDV